MLHKKNRELINTLNNCAVICSHCAVACLEEKEVKMLATCIKLDIDCAEICRTVSAFLARGSQHGIHLLRECAEICKACAAECKKHEHMEHCRECAVTCAQCSEECMAHTGEAA